MTVESAANEGEEEEANDCEFKAANEEEAEEGEA